VQDLSHLASLGATEEHLRSLFEAKKPSDGVKRLRELHYSRISNAVDLNTREAPLYGAIDRALEAARNSLPYIQARELATSGKKHEEIIADFKAFNLDRMIQDAVNPNTGETVKYPNSDKVVATIDLPLFDTVMVPLAAAYADIRVAKLFNDRNTVPRYKYSPPRLTTKDMLVTEIITSRVQRMTQEMGYSDSDKQEIRQMAYYGAAWSFPREAYHRERYATKSEGKVVHKIQREGVRFITPHPRRTFYDRAYPAYTFNTDTGVSFAGYWDVKPYREIKDNVAFWNKDKISVGGYSWFTTMAWRIANIFYPTAVEIPDRIKDLTWGSAWSKDRTDSNYFNNDELDSSVTVVVLFDKLIPKDFGLFDYDQPVWMRFVYAGTDTVIHAEVLPYTPGYVLLDRYDANFAAGNSLALNLIPYQQLLGNFLTQHALSVKHNLTRIAFLNTDLLGTNVIDQIVGQKNKFYKQAVFLPYSRSKMLSGFPQDVQKDAVTPLNFQPINTQEIVSQFNLTFAAIERLLGFSAQEVGSAASHEQSAAEVNIILGSTSVTLEFMGDGIDRAVAAKKRLLYEALFCYSDDEVFAEVADLTPEREAALKELGFEVETPAQPGAVTFGVKGRKAALVLDSFVSEREGANRLNDSKLGIAMLQSLGQVAGNPALFQSVGAKQFLTLFNYVWKMVGLPDDFRLKFDAKSEPEAQQQQMMQAIQQMKDQIAQNAAQIVAQQMVPGVKSEFEKVAQGIQQLAQQLVQQDQALAQQNQQQDQALVAHEQALQQIVQVLANAAQPQPQSVPVPPPVEPPPGVPGGPAGLVGVGGPPVV